MPSCLVTYVTVSGGGLLTCTLGAPAPPNPFAIGETVTFSGFTNATFLNGQSATIISSGFTSTQFQANTAFSLFPIDTGSGADAGTATYTPSSLNPSFALLASSESPSNFEDEVTFTATVSDVIVGDPNTNTAPLGTVDFVADGSFGIDSVSLVPLASAPSAISATTAIATYIGANNFSAGQYVTISGFTGPYTQFNQTNVIIATAAANTFTVAGTYTTQAQVNEDGTVISTSTSQAQASTTVLPVGLHTVVAQYLGDSTPGTGHLPVNSNTVTQQVLAVNVSNVVEVPGFALIGSYSTQGDSSLPPTAQLFAVPLSATPNEAINLLWDTLNVAYIAVTGNNGVDYQPGGFNTGFVSTSGSGIYVVAGGFTATITLSLQAYDATHTAIPGLISVVTITIT